MVIGACSLNNRPGPLFQAFTVFKINYFDIFTFIYSKILLQDSENYVLLESFEMPLEAF